MTQRPRILIAQQQRLALNASLHAAIRLLRSDTAGLTRYLEEQATENPHLRLIAPQAAGLGDWLPRWSGAFNFGAAPPGYHPETAAAAPGLVAHVMQSLRSSGLEPTDWPVALALVEALEPSGWMGRGTGEIAAELGRPEDDVLAVLKRLQRLEPAGIFARNLAECLALQLADSGQLDREMQIILAHLDLLAAGDIARLARLCGCEAEAVIARFRIIRGLNPKPGATFSVGDPAHLREPDLLATPLKDGRWKIELNRSALPALEVIAPDPEGEEPKGQSDAAALGRAKALNNMLLARNNTLLRVGREIAARQVAALIQGPAALRPMRMADLAEVLDLHVSTISRVVAGASMDSPYGTWWLRRMFSGARGGKTPREDSIGGAQSGMAAAALRHHLARLIAAEVPSAPLSDLELAERLTQETGVTLARRTIAQYRKAEGIPPAHRRRRGTPTRALLQGGKARKPG